MAKDRTDKHKPIDRELAQKMRLHAAAVFTPSAPLNRKDLFAGRSKEIGRLVGAATQTGQHAIIFGERGAGKTSLSNVLKDFLDAVDSSFDDDNEAKVICIKTTCTTDSTYDSIWRDAFSNSFIGMSRRAGFRQKDQTDFYPTQLALPDEINANFVRDTLNRLGHGTLLVVVIDEFDRINARGVRQEFADTIKVLSDHSTPATLVLVGVADDVNQLIADHESIARALKQVKIPLMTDDELGEIVQKGYDRLQVAIEEDAKQIIVRLSQGFPHYVHLLALSAVNEALDRLERVVTKSILMQNAIPAALSDADASITREYQKAIASSQKTTMYPDVLLACALARLDEFGYFSAKDVCEPLSIIQGRPRIIQNYAANLSSLSEDTDRGPALQRIGGRKKYRYKFRNPLLRPFVVSRGLADGRITADHLAESFLGNKPAQK